MTSDNGGADGGPDRGVELVLPADARCLRLARLLAGGLGSLAEFDIEAVDDLRIAVDELCAVIVSHADPAAVLVITFEVTGGEVRVEARAPARAGGADIGPEVDIDELSRLILLAAADEHGVTCRDGGIVGRLRKSPAGTDG